MTSTATDGHNVKSHKRKPEDENAEDENAIDRNLIKRNRKRPRQFNPKTQPTTSSPACSPQNNSSPNQVDTHTPPSSPQNNFSPSQVAINTTPKAISPINGYQQHTPPSSSTIHSSISGLDSAGGSIEISEGGSPGPVSVKLEMEAGEYFVKIERRRVTSSSDERHKVEDTKKLAQSAGVLFLQAQIIREIGEQLLANAKTSFNI